MNVRGGFTRQLFPERRRSQGFDLSSLGFANSLVSLVPADLATFPNVTFDGYQNFSPVGIRRRVLHHRRLQRDRQPRVADRQSQPEARHRIPPLRRELEPLPDRGVAHHRFGNTWTRGPIDNSAGSASRSGLRLVPARPADRWIDEPRGGIHRAQRRVRPVCAQRLARAQQPDAQPRSPVGVRESADRSGRSHGQRLRLRHAAADRPHGPGELRAESDSGSARVRVPGARRRALPGHRRPQGGVERRLRELHAARRLLLAAAAEDRRSRWLRALLRRARPQPHQRQPDRLFTQHRADRVARQRPDVHCDARRPVPERAARTSGQRARADDERRPRRGLPVQRRRPHSAHAPVVDRRAARAAGGLPGRGHLRRVVLREHPGRERAESRSRPVLLHLAGARRRDQQLPVAAGRRIRLPDCCRAPTSTAPTSPGRSCFGPYPQFTGIQRRWRPTARPTTPRSRADWNGGW